jgi:hypothetical protein
MKIKEKIRSLISQGKLPQALALAQENFPYENEFILLSGRFQRVERDARMGVIGRESYSLEHNQIVYSILDLLAVLEEGFTQQNPLEPQTPSRLKKVFMGSVEADEKYSKGLEKQLQSLVDQGRISLSSRMGILGGMNIVETLSEKIAEADIILLLISADFIASKEETDDLLRKIEVAQQKKDIRLIPVLVRPCLWEYGILKGLNPLPQNKIPLSQWEDIDAAYLDIIMEMLKTL